MAVFIVDLPHLKEFVTGRSLQSSAPRGPCCSRSYVRDRECPSAFHRRTTYSTPDWNPGSLPTYGQDEISPISTVNTSAEVQLDLEHLWPNGVGSHTFYDTFLNTRHPVTVFLGAYFLDPILNTYAAFNNSYSYQLQAIFANFIVSCATYYMASAAIHTGVSVYKMMWKTGAEIHSSDSAYLLHESPSTDNATLADQIKDYFVSFIVRLNPNIGGRVYKATWL